MRQFIVRLLIAFLILVIGNILSLYPFSLNLKDTSPDNPDDVLLNSYIMQWEYERIFSLDIKNYFNTLYYYPYKNTLAFTEHHTISQLFFIPLFSIFKDPVLVHNIMILILLVLAGLTMFIYIHYLTGSFFVSLLGGVLFSFVPYRYTHLVHVNVLHWWLIPLTFLSFYIYANKISLLNSLCFGLTLLGMFLWSNNLTAFFIIPFSIYALFIVWDKALFFNKRFYIYSGMVFVFVLLFVLPFLLQYFKLREEMFFERFLFDVRYFSPQIKNFMGVHESNLLWGKILGKNGKWECYLFPGATFLFLSALSAMFLPFNAYRKYTCLFMGMAIISLIFTFGPYFNGLEGKIKAPYYLLWEYMPGYYGIRVPTRFAIFFFFAMATAISLSIGGIYEKLKSHEFIRSIFIISFLIIFYILEGSHKINLKTPLNHPERDPLYKKLKELPDGVLFEFPAYVRYKDASHVFAILYHRKPTINGYSGWGSKPLENLYNASLNFHPSALIEFFNDINVKYFILRGNVASEVYNRLSKLDEYNSGVKKLFQDGKDILFQIDNSSLKIFNYYEEELSDAKFYLPSCIRTDSKVNGGIVFDSTEQFYFSHRRRYRDTLEFIDKSNNLRKRVSTDVIAYRVYEPGNVHLLLKFKAKLPEGRYSVYLRNVLVRENIDISSFCHNELSDKIEISDINIPINLLEGEPIKIDFLIKNKEKYLLAAVDIDDFTTDGVFRVGIFLEGIDDGNRNIRYEVRYPIYSDMSAGDVIHFGQKIPLYLTKGRYKLKVDFVSEKRFWFSNRGLLPIEREIIVGNQK
ncbi:MAG: hypothetical protein N2746_07615 [Deltaproteobacteria bacterium]|nr:hypothetical protein [Deltaproteobacteria bacterium]